jgi:hypothetical protein
LAQHLQEHRHRLLPMAIELSSFSVAQATVSRLSSLHFCLKLLQRTGLLVVLRAAQ